MFLDHATFRAVVSSTPLVSLDLVILNSDKKALLGKRINPPAEGFWFVPGGRIQKGESIADAFSRLTLAEIGVEVALADAQHIGLFEHFYPDSIFGENISTHYVVNAFQIELSSLGADLPCDQHSQFDWFTVEELKAREDVHLHTKWYFQP